MAERKPISKRVRFEVFKRDTFTCQYCGRTPPNVILHIDHVLAVANGGNNDVDNLLTSCEDCNLGKGARPLHITPESRKESIERRQELAAQTEAFNDFLIDERERITQHIEALGSTWFDYIYPDGHNWIFGRERAASIRQFLKHLAPTQIAEAMEIAHSKCRAYGENDNRVWSYFCGVCWRKIKKDSDL